jgi:hypothetical protein
VAPEPALIDLPLHGLSEAQVAQPPLPAGQLDGLYRLSPMQQGMLFLGLNSPESDLYVNQLSVPVQGLEPLRLQAAWESVSRRHDILRTGFLWQDMAEPLQFVLADPQLPFSLLDWRERDHSAEALQGLADAERAKGFDLDQPPLQRLTLVQVGEHSYQLIWTYHHILIDGWSSSQLIGEVLSQYSGRPLADAVPYRGYINWLQQQDANASEGFWRQHLSLLDEPTYLADAVTRTGSGRGHQALYSRLGEARTEQLKAFAQAQQVTLNTLVQGRVAGAAQPLQRPALRGVRRHGGGASGEPAGFGIDRPVHQHLAGDQGRAGRAGRGRLVARVAGFQPGDARARVHPADRRPALGRACRAVAVRQHHGVRKPPDRSGAARVAR